MSQGASSTSWSDGRRGALALVLGLAGCGFRPAYGPVAAADGSERDVQSEMAAVRVGDLFDRNGQLLRRMLQRRFEGVAAGGTAARYELQLSITSSAEVLGYRRDGGITRVRYIMNSPWVLQTLAVPPQPLARGTARAFDAFNVPDLQFFAADISREAMERRLLEEIGEQVVLGVVLELRRRLESRT